MHLPLADRTATCGDIGHCDLLALDLHSDTFLPALIIEDNSNYRELI